MKMGMRVLEIRLLVLKNWIFEIVNTFFASVVFVCCRTKDFEYSIAFIETTDKIEI
jgi:hypothetical protein